jgi:putative membrane protein
MFYLFLQSLVPTVPASFLTLSDAPLYKAYAHLPKLWGITTIDDQRVAGLLMKVGGGFILWGFIASIFFRWAYQEERGEGALLWEDVERELKQVGPPPAA